MRQKRLWVGGALAALLLLAACAPVKTTRVTFAGDIILSRDARPLFDANPWGAFSQTDAEASLPERFFFANLESPLGSNDLTPAAGSLNLCADPTLAHQLRLGGVTLVSTANNHAGDCGLSDNTAEALSDAGIQAVDDTAPFYLETQAGVIGVLAVNTMAPDWDPAPLLERAAQVREHCDFLVVSLHWGDEYKAEPSRGQRDLAQSLADAGVDVLWGHHPHTLQTMEWISSADKQHQMLALYSLGNLLTDQGMSWETQHSALVTLELTGSKITSVKAVPVWMDPFKHQLQAPDEGSIARVLERLGNRFH